MTIHTLQGDCREMFNTFHDNDDHVLAIKPSPLTPHLSPKLAFWLQEKYLASATNAKKPDRKWVEGKSDADTITELVRLDYDQRKRRGLAAPKFLMIVTDEAHFLRNQPSFWGILATLLGTHCQRHMLLTGTPCGLPQPPTQPSTACWLPHPPRWLTAHGSAPSCHHRYNNKETDIAALCAYYDVGKVQLNRQATLKWWQQALGIKPVAEQKAIERLEAQLKEWRSSRWLRRTMRDAAIQLPKRHTTVVRVLPSEKELNCGYLEVAKNILKVWQQLMAHHASPRGGSPHMRWIWLKKLNALMQQLLGLFQKARSECRREGRSPRMPTNHPALCPAASHPPVHWYVRGHALASLSAHAASCCWLLRHRGDAPLRSRPPPPR